MQDAMPSVRWLNFDYFRARGIVLSDAGVQALCDLARKTPGLAVVHAAPLMIPAGDSALYGLKGAMLPMLGSLLVWLQTPSGYRLSVTLRSHAWRHALPN